MKNKTTPFFLKNICFVVDDCLRPRERAMAPSWLFKFLTLSPILLIKPFYFV